MTVARLTREQARQRNRDALLDAAAAQFAERGFRVATIDDVAEAAGLTKGAVYSHFANKHELFAEAIRRRYDDRFAAFVATMSDESLGVAERAERAAAEFARSVTAGADWALLFVEAWAEMLRTPGFGSELRAATDAFRSALARFVEEQLAAQGRRSAVPVEQVAEMILAMSHGFGIEHRLDPEHAPASVFAELTATFTAGLLARSVPLD